MKKKQLVWMRIIIQIVFFILAPAVYASAFTAIKLAVAAISSGSVLAVSDFVWNLALTVGFTICFGRFFCGYACAFGSLGDWIYRFVQWIQKRRHPVWLKISKKCSDRLQYLKYGVLVGILAACFFGQSAVISNNSPWTVFSMLRAGNFAIGRFWPGFLILLGILVGMAAKERFFCQYLCPMGAVFSLLPTLPFGMFSRDRAACFKGCRACQNNCPVMLELDAENLKMGECIRCGACVSVCPKKHISSTKRWSGQKEWIYTLVQAALLLVLTLCLVK